MISKVDVCINFYGKPYQTVVTIKSLWKHSNKHINRIFVILEKVQPHHDYESIVLVKHLLEGLPITFYTPEVFLALGTPAEHLLSIPKQRYGLNFQYAFEKTTQDFLFISHNDCLYHDDLLGQMIDRVEAEGDYSHIAGVGLIGQCWNCPAAFAKVCDSTKFEKYIPSKEELTHLVDKYSPPRAKIHHKLIQAGFIHPLPECRLNEHACLINAKLYNQVVKPVGEVLPLGGNWQGTDTGAIWFYQMVNRGSKFIHFPFEPAMTHAPFATSESGTKSDNDLEEYRAIEQKALSYLLAHKYIENTDLPRRVRMKKAYVKYLHIVKRKLV